MLPEHIVRTESSQKPAILSGRETVTELRGYTIQRLYLQNKYRNDTTTAHQLWTKQQLNTSDYAPSTQITDHFVVLSKSPTSILIRCGDSPLTSPDSPRASDGLFEMCAVANLDEGYAEFRLKSIFYVGDENWAGATTTGQSGEGAGAGGKEVAEKWENKGPMQGSMWYAHKLYTKLWMECGLSRVKS
ncbi:hypothetical protein H2200_001004 [Cladophialophora chaetospira]|uniref:Uncharacterized protein n=1 Tax=Cladophialophora chaetospira TaxID=386627 RepID=A0AA38XPJ7_9EURO|nr:hypothetical protein H2200_001004 [Cladophialophora chaetospira]